MRNRIEYVFTSGFTAQGYYSHLPALLKSIEKVILLQGAPGSGRSTFIRSVGLNLAERGYRVQFWPSPLDVSYIEGVYVQQLKTVVMNGEAAGDAKIENHPGIVIESIDLGEYYNSREIEDYQEEIALLTDQLESIMGGVRSNLEAARDNHKKLAGSYEQLINTGKLQAVSQELITRILGDVDQAVHYFARAITSDGLVDFFEEITGECSRRYILRDHPGTANPGLCAASGRKPWRRGTGWAFITAGWTPICWRWWCCIVWKPR